MSVLSHRSVGRASVSALVLAVVAALSFLDQGSTGSADASSVSSGQGSVSQASSELGVVPATPRASFGKSEVQREHRTGLGLALPMVDAAVFTLVAAHVPSLPLADPAVRGVAGPPVARAPPATPAV